MESKNLIGGLLAGVAIGVAIGMLLAPANGRKTQRKLSNKSRKLLESLKGSAAESTSYLKEKYDEGVEEVYKKGNEMGSMISENGNSK